MTVSLAEVKTIAESLPIGLYAKRRIPTTMDDSAETSYYNPIVDEIVISYPIIAQGLEKVSDESYRETAIRSMLYHEVSHAILTPDCLKMTNWMNIFEDERIETILAHYYLDVNFKKQVLLINGYESLSDVGTPKNGLEYFYNIVRFGKGKKEFVDKATNLIRKYKGYTKLTEDAYYYYWDVKNFYDEVCNDFATNPPPQNDDSENGENGDSDGASAKSLDKVDGKSSSSKSSKKIKSSSASSDSSETGGKPDEAENGAIPSDRDIGINSDEIGELVKGVLTENPYIDNALTQKMSVVIDNFSKKNNSGSAMSAYSGVFNPRQIAVRDDYRYWEKKASVNGMNRFGTLHLNLFIDESGSFYESETAMNTLLRSLTDIEARNKNFTLDVVFCGMGERLITDKKKRVFSANGGNRLDKEVYGIYRKLQKPNTYNYNIACFDGDACSDGGRNDHGFGAFDNGNCTIISDKSNRCYIEKDVHNAKVIYTNDYAQELIDNVVEILTKAFR